MAESRWSLPMQLDASSAIHADDVTLTVDRYGLMTAIWREIDRSGQWIKARRYKPLQGWDTALALNVERDVEVRLPEATALLDGSVLVTWQERNALSVATSEDVSEPRLWSLQYAYMDETGRFSKAQPLEYNDRGSVAEVAIIAQRSGGAWVAWTQFNGLRWALYSARFTEQASFSNAYEVSEESEADVFEPSILDMLYGRVLAVWRQQSPAGSTLHSSTFTATSGWSPAIAVSPPNVYARDAQLAFDIATDRAAALWSLGQEPAISLYSWSAGWDQSQRANIKSDALLQLDLAHTDQHTIGVWSSEELEKGRIYGAQLSTEQRWGEKSIAHEEAGRLSEPTVALGGERGAVAFVSTNKDGQAITSALWQSAAGWQEGLTLTERSAQSFSQPRAVADCKGAIGLVWKQTGVNRHVWVSVQR